MKKNPFSLVVFFLLIFTGSSCNSSYQPASLSHRSYRVTDSLQEDKQLKQLIHPYWEQVTKTMNTVIGIASITLEKKSTESTLGNFMTDAFFSMAAEKYNTKIDAAFMNYGGIRLTQLPAGNVTTGKIFELMPFDNLLNIQEIKGDVFQQFLDLTASHGGWPVAGLTMQIKDKKAVNVEIGGKPLDPVAVYTIVNTDFVSNGGENANMLKSIPQKTIGYLVRDALFDYIKKLKSQGKNIEARIENRVTHVQ